MVIEAQSFNRRLTTTIASKQTTAQRHENKAMAENSKMQANTTTTITSDEKKSENTSPAANTTTTAAAAAHPPSPPTQQPPSQAERQPAAPRWRDEEWRQKLRSRLLALGTPPEEAVWVDGVDNPMTAVLCPAPYQQPFRLMWCGMKRKPKPPAK